MTTSTVGLTLATAGLLVTFRRGFRKKHFGLGLQFKMQKS